MFEFNPNKTYIRFSAGSDPISWLVQARTGCKWSHADLLLPDGKLLGALPGSGVQARSRIRGEIRSCICEVPIAKGYEWSLKQVGKPYDWGAVAGLASPFPIKRNWMDEKHWFCSELAYASLLHAGISLFSQEAWGITPRDLLISSYVKAIE